MKSQVFGISLRTHFRESLSDKLLRLFKALEPEKLAAPKSIWAVKLHFGERGGHSFIRPHLVRVFTDALRAMSARPFLTDTNTLYVGGRSNSADHLETAVLHGFGFEVTGAPLIIADGLRGAAEVGIPLTGGTLSKAWIAADFAAADGVLALTHFKGHELTGFGGALKNVGMGAASRRGKLEQHSDLGPKIKTAKCLGCRRCLSQCAHGAIALTEEKKARIDPDKCVGCAGCIPVCPEGAIDIQWDGDAPKFMRKMMEYAKAALSGKGDRALFVNFVTGLSPLCDCSNHSDAPIAADLGILAGRDPVALDLASAELVNQAPGLTPSALPESALAAGADKWEALHPGCQWPFQLEYAEKIGLGRRDYELIWLPEVQGVA
ncbi:MAG: DUF362 domain-containing protein [Candidatus Adiutrix sp.]|nr:DUF362 domain-containing protein [Candidatus Adiutrix sp.]